MDTWRPAGDNSEKRPLRSQECLLGSLTPVAHSDVLNVMIFLSPCPTSPLLLSESSPREITCTQVLVSESAFGVGRTQAVTRVQHDVNKDLVITALILYGFVKTSRDLPSER